MHMQSDSNKMWYGQTHGWGRRKWLSFTWSWFYLRPRLESGLFPMVGVTNTMRLQNPWGHDLPWSRPPLTAKAAPNSSTQPSSYTTSVFEQGNPTHPFVVFQSLSRIRLFVTPWTAAQHASLSFNISPSLLLLMSVESLPPYPLILCRPLRLLPSIFPSIRVFSNESSLCIRWLKYWSFTSPSVLPVNIRNWFLLGWTGLISLLSKGLKSLLQHHSLKASILRHSAFFMVQHSHSNMTTGKTIALTTWTFVDKVTSLLYNMLSRFVTAFLPRSKRPAISESKTLHWTLKKSENLAVPSKSVNSLLKM